jgi:hypothetical protein
MNAKLIDRLYMADTLQEYIRKLESLDATWRMLEEDRRSRRTTEGHTGSRRGNVPMRTRANWTTQQTKLAREGPCFLCKERGHRRDPASCNCTWGRVNDRSAGGEYLSE